MNGWFDCVKVQRTFIMNRGERGLEKKKKIFIYEEMEMRNVQKKYKEKGIKKKKN